MTQLKIASLLASSTEILHGLGLWSSVVAVSHECDYPAEVVDKPRVTTSFVDDSASSGEIDAQVRALSKASGAIYDVDVAQLARLAPDLIVTQSHCDVCAVSLDAVVQAVETTPELAQTEVVALNPSTLEGIFDDIRRVGAATGREAEAAEFCDRLIARVDAVRESVAGADRPRVACVEWVEPLMLGANWMPGLVEIAGGTHGLVKPGEKTVYTAWEALREYDPEVVVVMPCGFDLARTLVELPVLSSLEGWAELSACRAQRVYAVDGNAYFNRSGPRMLDSLEILAHLLHPGRFAAPDYPQSWARIDLWD